MVFRDRKFSLFTPFFVAMLLLASCSPSQTAAPAPPAANQGPAGDLNVALVSLGTENWIPRLNNPDEQPVWELLQDPIIGTSRTDGFTPDLTQGLVDKWDLKLTGDKVDLMLHFRPNIPFHKGEGTVKATDFKFTIAQLIRDGSLTGAAGDMKKMINGDVSNIEIQDELTAIIHTTTALTRAGFQNAMAIGNIQGVLPQAYFERVGGEDGYRKAPIGTGPFQFVEHKPGEYIKFQALDTHWRKVSTYKNVTLYKVPDPNTAQAQLQTGKVDIAGLSPRQLAEIKNNKDIRVDRVQNSGELFVIFGGMVQPTRPAYDPKSPWTGANLLDPGPTKVREALTIAVDQKTIIDKLLLGEARAVSVPYLLDVQGAPWYNPAWKPREYNPTRAKQLLAEAGYPNGFSIKAFIYPLPYNPSNGDVMEAVAGYWEAIGIKVERVPAEYRPTVRQQLTDRTTAGYMYSYTQPSYSDPYFYISGSCCFRTDAVLNHWEITQIDQLTDQARLAYDDAKRNAVMKQVGDFIYNNYIGLPIAATTNLWGVRTEKVGKWPQAPGASTLKNLEYITK